MKNNIQNVSAAYGIDAEKQLTEMLSEQLAREIDKEIMGDIHLQIIKGKLDILLKQKMREDKIDSIIDE